MSTHHLIITIPGIIPGMIPGIGDPLPAGAGMSAFLFTGEILTGTPGDGMADVVIPMLHLMLAITPRIPPGDIITIPHIITIIRRNMPRGHLTDDPPYPRDLLPVAVEGVAGQLPGRKLPRPTPATHGV